MSLPRLVGITRQIRDRTMTDLNNTDDLWNLTVAVEDRLHWLTNNTDSDQKEIDDFTSLMLKLKLLLEGLDND